MRGASRSLYQPSRPRVVATARNTDSLKDVVERFPDAILALPLDVTDRAAVFATVQRGFEHFGRLDVVVNNAGYGQFGMIEELSEAELRDQLETYIDSPKRVEVATQPPSRPRRSSAQSGRSGER